MKLALENEAKKLRQEKMQYTQNWVQELNGAEGRSGMECESEMSTNVVDCSMSNESTLSRSFICMPDISAHLRDRSVHRPKRSSQLKESLYPVLKHNATTPQESTSLPLLSDDLNIIEGTCNTHDHVIQESTSLLLLTDDLNIIEDNTHKHAVQASTPTHMKTKESSLPFTEDSAQNLVQQMIGAEAQQDSVMQPDEDFIDICDAGTSLLNADVTVIYVIPGANSFVIPSEVRAGDGQLLEDGIGLPNNGSSGECDSRMQDLPGKQVSLFQKEGKKEVCKQAYDKVSYCTFCSKGITSKMARHLVTVHKDQAEVMKILLMPKRSKRRMDALSLLTNEGNFKHNSEVLKAGEGQIVVACRNPIGSQVHNPREYLPCSICKKFLLKSSLWIHTKKCSQRLATCSQSQVEGQKSSQKYGFAVSKGRSLLNSALLNDNEIVVGEMLQRMNDDDVKDVVTKDALIKRYSALRMESLGSKDCQKLNDVHRVSQGARTLARLVLECRKIKVVKDLDELIEPENFDLIVAATKKLAFEGEKPAASLGKLIGNILGHVISIKVGNALRCNNQIASEKAGNFRRLFEAEWNYRVNAVGTKIASKAKRQKIATIPITEDLKTLRSFILAEMTDTATRLEKFKLKSDWTWLAKLTLSRLILFNKRRRAEVKDLKVDDYLRRPKWNEDENGEMQMALTKTDAVLAKRLGLDLSLEVKLQCMSNCKIYCLWLTSV